MALSSAGELSLSTLNTYFVGPAGPVPMSRFYKACNGAPSSGSIRIQDFRGKSRLGLGETATIVSTFEISEQNMIFKIDGTGTTDSYVNFRSSISNANIHYHWNFRRSPQIVALNNLINGVWVNQIDVAFSSSGLSANVPYTIYLVVTPTAFIWQRSNRTTVHTFNHRTPGAPIFSIDFANVTVQRVLA